MGKSARIKNRLADQIYINTKNAINNAYNVLIEESKNNLSKISLKNNSDRDSNHTDGIDFFGKAGSNVLDDVNENKGHLGTARTIIGTEQESIGTKDTIIGTNNYNNIIFGYNEQSGDNLLDEKQEYNNKLRANINDIILKRDEELRKNDQDYFSGAIRSGIKLR